MIGEMGVLFNKNRSASILALSDCILISIPKDKFESHLASQPKWFKVLFETISGRLEETTRLLVEEKARK
jgi:CRP-like cAMP-binding protein